MPAIRDRPSENARAFNSTRSGAFYLIFEDRPGGSLIRAPRPPSEPQTRTQMDVYLINLSVWQAGIIKCGWSGGDKFIARAAVSSKASRAHWCQSRHIKLLTKGSAVAEREQPASQPASAVRPVPNTCYALELLATARPCSYSRADLIDLLSN